MPTGESSYVSRRVPRGDRTGRPFIPRRGKANIQSCAHRLSGDNRRTDPCRRPRRTTSDFPTRTLLALFLSACGYNFVRPWPDQSQFTPTHNGHLFTIYSSSLTLLTHLLPTSITTPTDSKMIPPRELPAHRWTTTL